MKWIVLTRKPNMKQRAVTTLEDIASINSPELNLVYFKRPAVKEIEHFTRHLIATNFRGVNEIVTPACYHDVLQAHLEAPQCYTGKDELMEDVTTLTGLFFKITNAKRIRMIMKIVADDACRKFHTDAYRLRLLCTYAGAGTEWIADQYANRKKLVGGTNKDIIKDPGMIQHMEPFEVGILKGEIAGKCIGHGIIHRSPELKCGSEKRFLLRLDPL